ncbi:MAG: flagellar biosynthesis protein FlgF, partial [Deltaproteobacteria bacterium]|nr:flagellar biosynthesis protein FlgF [Deltaproteobacteria bacterium]
MINGSGIEVMVNAATRQTRRLDSTVRNIANVNTAGFKAEQIRFLEGSTEEKSATTIDYSQGA